MNFFADQSRKKQSGAVKGLLLGGAALLVVAAAALTFLYFNAVKSDWETKLKEIDLALSDPALLADTAEINRQLALLNAFKSINEILETTDAKVDTYFKLSSEDLKKTVESLPAGVSLDSLEISGTQLLLTGTLTDVSVLPPLMHNLSATGLFDTITPVTAYRYTNQANPDPLTGVVPPETVTITFEVNCLLKGGVLS